MYLLKIHSISKNSIVDTVLINECVNSRSVYDVENNSKDDINIAKVTALVKYYTKDILSKNALNHLELKLRGNKHFIFKTSDYDFKFKVIHVL